MTLNQLRAFLESASLGSFTAAAATLQVSQASVSELIRRLEDEHGVALFLRGRRRLVLTAAGQELLPHAQRAVAAATGAVTGVPGQVGYMMPPSAWARARTLARGADVVLASTVRAVRGPLDAPVVLPEGPAAPEPGDAPATQTLSVPVTEPVTEPDAP